MKAYINRTPVRGPWGGGNQFVRAFHEWHGDNVTLVSSDQLSVAPDVILLAGLDNDNQGGVSAEQAIQYKMFMQGRKDIKVVVRVNENDARKGTTGVDDLLLQLSQYTDGTVFVSNWLRDYFLEKGWADKNHTVIYNGVDQEVFKRGDAIPNELNNIVAHHWSDNYMKGFDVYDKLDEWVGKNPGFTFTYIGRERGTFKNTKVVRPLHGKRLGAELGKYDVYVSASRFDPGPNHILEALACGLPTFVHKDGGGCVEFAGADHTYSTFEELVSLLTAGAWDGNDKAIRLSAWPDCIREYIDFLEATCQKASISGFTNS